MQIETKLLHLIDKYNVISFDIFDTLVKRNVARASDIFDRTEYYYNLSHENKVNDFRNTRILAEKTARSRTIDEEINIYDIYNYITFPKVDNNELLKIELEVELAHCQTNYSLKAVYDYAIKQNKFVAIISDMYLPQAIIEEILIKCGYSKYDKLYISSESKKTKRTGSLYDLFLSDTKIKAASVLHIGDNKRSDYFMPRMKGMHSYHIDRDKVNTLLLSKEDIFCSNNKILPFLNNNITCYRKESKAYRLGYELLGPLIVGFCSWIHSEDEKEVFDEIYFLARDMYLVIKAYNLLYGDEKTRYIEVSRKSVRNEYVRKKGKVEAVFDTLSRKRYSVNDVIDSMSLDQSKIRELVNPDLLDKSLEDIEPETRLSINNIILKMLNDSNDYSKRYLIKNGLANGKNALVDIGWHGTIQNIIEKIVDNPLYGLYFGSTKRKNYNNLLCKGYWFDYCDESLAKNKLAITYILEVMLFPNHGTTISYSIEDNEIQPQYDNFESTNQYFIKKFQKGALQFVEDISSSEILIDNVSSKEAVSPYEKLAFTPTYDLARIFGDLTLEDGKLYYLANPKPLYYYMSHPAAFANDYKVARWKEGFVKRLFPVIKDPHSLVCIIKEMH